MLRKTRIGNDTEHKAVNLVKMRTLYLESDALRELITDLWVDLIKDIQFLRTLSTDPDKVSIFLYTRDKVQKETERTYRLMTFV